MARSRHGTRGDPRHLDEEVSDGEYRGADQDDSTDQATGHGLYPSDMLEEYPSYSTFQFGLTNMSGNENLGRPLLGHTSSAESSYYTKSTASAAQGALPRSYTSVTDNNFEDVPPVGSDYVPLYSPTPGEWLRNILIDFRAEQARKDTEPTAPPMAPASTFVVPATAAALAGANTAPMSFVSPPSIVQPQVPPQGGSATALLFNRPYGIPAHGGFPPPSPGTGGQQSDGTSRQRYRIPLVTRDLRTPPVRRSPMANVSAPTAAAVAPNPDQIGWPLEAFPPGTALRYLLWVELRQ